ncbi:hypothetical protein L6164_026166 [Bauhinia variegata]|uniref:Uncharacterized protein n=1 Tax=Bauhinia variegata TaxID=167791 RepID=A0ACB9LPF3_BAUVA|nr:hypothetical protein L6164_026166 [Bauhinia variegata]
MFYFLTYMMLLEFSFFVVVVVFMVKIAIVVEKGLQLLEEMQRRNEAADHSVEQRELTGGSAPAIIIKQKGQIQGHFNGAVIENLNLKTSDGAIFLNLPFFFPSWDSFHIFLIRP